MKFVIDTSVAVKWFLPEPGHDTAVALLATEAVFRAPDLIFTEFASAMQKKLRLGEADWQLAAESCRSLPDLFELIVPSLVLFRRALQIAVAMSHPVQDCMFLACAEQAGSCLVTADLKLIQKAAERGFGHLVLELDAAVAHSSTDTHRDA
ncbi:type II toxin-antitoxin system VapC family toxin [Methylobacterium sp. J-090]|uniref:type II toxin-antitoxin system VapC family toxin n=1 Tax=Methylobacterium sp. J-090 TaxID=2836666 RepID=UPI001FB8DF5C|nr:type II toxin-antitoxin system VapC family toxin [Methylobacterium sp. J-090]MCJ2082350.1 type II toxin-antitoxin system VapC family toxin [Methylobacterium sp. J-090]